MKKYSGVGLRFKNAPKFFIFYATFLYIFLNDFNEFFLQIQFVYVSSICRN